jgi:hypothetical protein
MPEVRRSTAIMWLFFSMKYQALEALKTKTKLLKMCDTLPEAISVITSLGARFESLTYIGGFPHFVRLPAGTETRQRHYEIQGSCDMGNGQSVVCSLDKKELEAVGF